MLSEREIRLLEARVADRFRYPEAVLFGFARSGLSVLLEALGIARDATLVIPSNLCPIVVTVAKERGLSVQLCPVDADCGLAADATFTRALSLTNGIGAVMPAHTYGYVAGYARTVAKARERGWFVIESDTMATKASGGEDSLPAFGDALITSFGQDKMIRAGGGGAVLLRDSSLAREVRRLARSLPPVNQAARDRDAWLMALRRTARAAPKGALPIAMGELLYEREAADLRYGFAADLAALLEHALDSHSERVRSNRLRSGWWTQSLRGLHGRLRFVDTLQPVAWRFNLIVRRGRDHVVRALRGAGVDAGTNYRPLHDDFPTWLRGQAHESATHWAEHVINLWVSNEYDSARIRAAAQIIRSALDETDRVHCR